MNKEIPILDNICDLVDLDAFMIKLYTNETIDPFSFLVYQRISKYPEEGIEFLRRLEEKGISSELHEFKRNTKVNYCKIVFGIIRRYDIRELISDERIRRVFEIILEVSAECEEEGLLIYSFLITAGFHELIEEDQFKENCSFLLDMIADPENNKEERIIIENFLYDD